MKTLLCNLSDAALARIVNQSETELNGALLREAAIEIEHRAKLKADRQERLTEFLHTPSQTLRAIEDANADWY